MMRFKMDLYKYKEMCFFVMLNHQGVHMALSSRVPWARTASKWVTDAEKTA